ncbi:hypothetical protein HD806DRAFT_510258 [Xylariaceae sp. AK1471]|nr:hypothetical protein HD806DRAFT_510258 [Xylariaceae sp. AK1471]
MPPKRRSTGTSGPASKKAKTAKAAKAAKTADSESEADTYEPPRSKRWAKVSASGNADGDYRMVWKNEEKAYSYITLCTAYYAADSDSEDEDEEDSEDGDKEDDDSAEDGDEEEDDDDDGVERLGPRCDRKKRCVCFLPAAANPEHPWVISWAGFRKFNNQFIHASLRNPDNFDMYTFNDHAGYGSLEVLQNLFLDFEEAAKEKRGEWREQWAVCEGTVHWLLHSNGALFTQIGDGECVHATMRLVGRMFLAMLAQLDYLGLMDDATEVKSLGCTMAMYIALVAEMRNYSALGGDPRKAYTGTKALQPDYFEDAILSYANKRGITLRGPKDIDELVAEAVGEVELPQKNAKDPWGWNAQFKKYKKDYVGISFHGKGASQIGGDGLDITTWSPAERKAASFDKKDPVGKDGIDALKKGLVMRMA